MCDVLQDPTTRKLIVMPRGTFKSSITSVAYVIWRLINDPNLRILIDSEVYTNSVAFLRQIKGIIQSDKFMELFGDWRTRNWNEGELTISTRTVNHKEATIRCGGVGVSLVSQHYSLIICDDLNTEKNSMTPEACEKVLNHYRMLLPILEPEGTLIVVGTRYSTADVIQVVIDTELSDEQRKEIEKA